MTVEVNGREHELEGEETIESLLEKLSLAAGFALVERNGEQVDRARYAEVELADRDRLVVARPVAGG